MLDTQQFNTAGTSPEMLKNMQTLT